MTVEREIDWITIEGAYLADILSIRAIARDHGVSESGIRKKAKEQNWRRAPANTKREIVKAHFAGSPSSQKSPGARSQPNGTQQPSAPTETVEPSRVQVQSAPTPPSAHRIAATTIASAAAQDIADMESGLFNARKILEVCGSYLETQFDPNFETGRLPDPKLLKAIVDTNGAAIDQIRRIRELDSKVGDELEALKMLVTAGWIPDVLLVAAFSEYRRLKPAIKTAFNGHFEQSRESGNAL